MKKMVSVFSFLILMISGTTFANTEGVCDGKIVTLFEYSTSTDQIVRSLREPIISFGAKKVSFYNPVETAIRNRLINPAAPRKAIVMFGDERLFQKAGTTKNCALAIADYLKDYIAVNKGLDVEVNVRPFFMDEVLRYHNSIYVELPAELK